jgi:hypothetical protein
VTPEKKQWAEGDVGEATQSSRPVPLCPYMEDFSFKRTSSSLYPLQAVNSSTRKGRRKHRRVPIFSQVFLFEQKMLDDNVEVNTMLVYLYFGSFCSITSGYGRL